MTIKKNGYFNISELNRLPCVPSEERLRQGPVVVIECAEEIPCNPCEEACHKGAIKIGESITNIPRLDDSICQGCGLCIPACPGQAIFVVDMDFSEKEATVQLPYEFLPRPEPGDIVEGLDRAGRKICNAKVLQVLDNKKFDGTMVVKIAVPKELGMEVRNIWLKGNELS